MATDETIEWMLDQIRSGVSQAEIAAALGVSTGTISAWLNAEGVAERSAQARVDSAEAWLDRGLSVVLQSLHRSSGVDANAARTFAQECARRAAVRNPIYRERTGIELTGAKGGPIKTLSATVSPEEAATLYKEVMG